MSSDTGMGHWAELSNYQLLIIIHSPHAYSPADRAFAAQEYTTREDNESNTNCTNDDPNY
jgi:hypothetical protein